MMSLFLKLWMKMLFIFQNKSNLLWNLVDVIDLFDLNILNAQNLIMLYQKLYAPSIKKSTDQFLYQENTFITGNLHQIAKILSDIKENCEKLITCTELLSQVVVINGKNHDVISDIKANFSINVRHC